MARTIRIIDCTNPDAVTTRTGCVVCKGPVKSGRCADAFCVGYLSRHEAERVFAAVTGR